MQESKEYMTNDYKQSTKELQALFETQLKYITRSLALYDQGEYDEAVRIATSLRVMLYDAKYSSLLKQIEQKNNMLFLSTSHPYIPTNGVAYTGFLTLQFSGGPHGNGKYVQSERGDPNSEKWLYFDDWWNEIILDDKKHVTSRKKIVLGVANKLGGAHVDEELPDYLAGLHYENSLGWKFVFNNDEFDFVNSPLYASLHKIALEFLESVSVNKSERLSITSAPDNAVALSIKDTVYFAPQKTLNHPIGSRLFIDSRVSDQMARKTMVEEYLHYDKRLKRVIIERQQNDGRVIPKIR